jgi:hypothetical protein
VPLVRSVGRLCPKMIEFDLVEELSFLQDKSYSIEFEVSLELLNNKEIAKVVEAVEIQYDPALIHQPKTWDRCRSIIKFDFMLTSGSLIT